MPIKTAARIFPALAAANSGRIGMTTGRRPPGDDMTGGLTARDPLCRH
jgi:hypothetical protein